jgi:DNA-binding NtrC family response regulator
MKKFTIFVLDDDKMFCSLLFALARRKDFVSNVDGYELDLIIYSNMKDLGGAIKKIEDNKPDLVLLDYFLGPGGCLSSLDVLKNIIPFCTDIKLITGMYVDDIRMHLVKEATDLMGIDIIQKPFSIEDLLGIIKNSIEEAEQDEKNV